MENIPSCGCELLPTNLADKGCIAPSTPRAGGRGVCYGYRLREREREMSGESLKGIPSFKVANYASPHTHKLLSRTSKSIVACRRDNVGLINKRSSRTPRRLITISTTDGRWQGNWSSDYLLSFRDLQLEDLIEDEHKDAKVSISLSIQKHASFGLSVDGRIITSFGSKCCKCLTPYCREVDTSFNVWVLPSSSNRKDPAAHLPEIGGDDPSVIYVKPGCEADLDALVQDTIRLTTAVKDTCSELCEGTESTWQFATDQDAKNADFVDQRWSRLLELKNSNMTAT